MEKPGFFQKIHVIFLYCLPAVLACGVLLYSYYGRILDIEQNINVECDTGAKECVLVEDIDCTAIHDKLKSAEESGKAADEALLDEEKNMQKICIYRHRFAGNLGFEPDIGSSRMLAPLDTPPAGVSSRSSAMAKRMGSGLCNGHGVNAACFKEKFNANTHHELLKIYIYNSAAVVILVLLPYLLMGHLLATSNRIKLTYDVRVERANANWWLKFLVGMIMAVGIIYIINPLGRGASTYYQFFISVGLQTEKTLPIYISNEDLVPVMAGFFGWYLHMIGYIFTKLIHHDVISARVYSLLFKKYIVTYGIALVLPQTGMFGEEKSASFLMFLIGMFPLSAMSMLIESLSKFGSKSEGSGGNLSQLPGISRWQILRLEEEGVDSMASLANIRLKTISENLQVIERLTCFWVDIARLYTIVGQEGYDKIKQHCMTASEFVKLSQKEDFRELIRGLETISEASEIATQIERTFGPNLDCLKESVKHHG